MLEIDAMSKSGMKLCIFYTLVLLTFLMLSSIVFAEEQCKVARPWYGSINCMEVQSYSTPQNYGDGQIFDCKVPNCEISSLTQQDWQCPLGSVKHGLTIYDASDNSILVNGEKVGGGNLNFGTGNIPYVFHKPTQIKIDFWCWGIQGTKNPENNPQVSIVYKPIKLKLFYDSGEGFVDNTEFCNINPIWNSYNMRQPQNPSQIQSIGSGLFNVISNSMAGTSVPSNTNGFLTPKNLEVDQSYWLVYDWVERLELIIKYKNNIPVWCNAIDNSLTKFEKVNVNSGSCYYIPSERLPGNVECCSSDQCKLAYNEQNVQCTDEFKCGYTKSCISDIDCGGVSSTCQSEAGKYYLVSSKCDKSNLDSYGKGKCISSKNEVICCTGQDGGPNVCGVGKYCDYNKGCQIILENCPAGKCCSSGGRYISQSCSSDLKCCPTSDPMIGDCKASCETTTTLVQSEAESGISGRAVMPTGPDMIIIAIVVIAVIGGVVGFILFKKGVISIEPTSKAIKEISKSDDKQTHDNMFCTKCGSKQKIDAKFCTNCGKKL